MPSPTFIDYGSLAPSPKTTSGHAAAETPTDAKSPDGSGGLVNFWGISPFLQGLKLVFLGNPGERPWLNVLLALAPVAIALKATNASSLSQFIFSILSMLPLAERLGFCTEELAEHVNDTFAGLMNASMGNAPELIIAIIALFNNEIRVVQLSLLGSILSNLLLVLGTSFFLGGLYFHEQSFSVVLQPASVAMLFMGVLAIGLPVSLKSTCTEASGSSDALSVSRISSVFLLAAYLCFIVFELKTHGDLFEDDDESDDEEKAMVEDGDAGEKTTDSDSNAVVADGAAAGKEEAPLAPNASTPPPCAPTQSPTRMSTSRSGRRFFGSLQLPRS